MSVTFSGTKKDASSSWGKSFVRLAHDDGEDRYFNLANANARLFLRFVGLPGADEPQPCGSVDMATALRAVQAARASFDYRVDALVRSPSEGFGPNGVHYFEGGVDADYFARRLAEFEEYLADLCLAGADGLSWG